MWVSRRTIARPRLESWFYEGCRRAARRQLRRQQITQKIQSAAESGKFIPCGGQLNAGGISKLWCDCVRTTPAIARGRNSLYSRSHSLLTRWWGAGGPSQGLGFGWKLMGGGLVSTCTGCGTACGTATFGGLIWAWLVMGSDSYFSTW